MIDNQLRFCIETRYDNRKNTEPLESNLETVSNLYAPQLGGQGSGLPESGDFTKFDFSIIISHVESMRDMVDNLIEVNKIENFSHIQHV